MDKTPKDSAGAIGRTFTQKIAGLIHLGRIPADVRTKLFAEGNMLYVAEGVCQTGIFRNFRAPGIYCSYRRQGFIGYFVLTKQRIVVRAGFFNKINLNLVYEDPNFKKLVFATTPKYLSVTFDPSWQTPDASGECEIRLHLPDIVTAAKVLVQEGAQLKAEDIAV